MDVKYELSGGARDFIREVEERIGTEVNLHRQPDAPHRGLLIDKYSHPTERNVILFSSEQLGLLKDFVIVQNCTKLAIRGIASNAGKYRMLSYGEECGVTGMEQVYLDILKDTKTRELDFDMKKKMIFYIYLLFHETISDIPWDILGHIQIAHQCREMRTAHVYFLLKESMRDMHDLVTIKDSIPNRYFVMHNAMFYARDLLLAEALAEYKLNPIINIPELQKFKNLSMMEMMTHRWQKSPWYHTKLVGDYLFNAMKKLNIIDVGKEGNYERMFSTGTELTDRWLKLMHLSNFYRWDSPENLQESVKNQEAIENAARMKIFGEI